MKTPSTYPVLDNRPIDQWRVTELKEELKRRKLITRGLKEDLVKRLDEALRSETESPKEDTGIIALDGSSQVVGTGDAVTCPVVSETSVDTRDHGNNKNQLDGGTHEPHIEDTEVLLGKKRVYEEDGTDGAGSARQEKTVVNVSSFDTNITIKDNLVSEKKADIDDAAVSLGEKKVQEAEVTGGTDSARDEDIVVNAISGENIATEEDTVSGIAIDVKESQNSDSKNDGRDSKSLLENEEVKLSQENVDLNSSDPNNEASEVSNITVSENVVSGTALTVNNDSQDQRGDLKSQLENEEMKISHEEVDLNSSDPNQVSEVSTVLGFQVKTDSISSDCVSINEKNELKDNIIDDNVKLELDVMPEMVQPSSSNVLADGGKLHPMDVEEPHENKAPVEERDDSNAAKAEMNKKNDGADVTSSEKLNLDRSSGEDYLEEDALENKQIDSKYNSDDVEDRSEKTSVLVVKEEAPVDIMLDDNLSDKKYIHDENKNVAVTPPVKRKLHGIEV